MERTAVNETLDTRILKIRRWLVLLLLAIFAATLTRANADSPHRAGLVIQHGDGSVETQCVTFPEESITGLDVVLRSGVDVNVDASNSQGATICRLGGEGCSYPQQNCFCQCTGSTCVYWSYWRWENGGWVYSSFGASSTTVTDGAVEGWVWGPGNVGAASPPPVRTIDEICTAATPTPTLMPSPVPTATPIPPAPLPTVPATATPPPTAPVIHTFTADRTEIVAGETVALRWELSGAEAAYLRVNGAEEGVVSPGEKIVTLSETTMFTLVARNAGSEVSAAVTIFVTPPTAAPAETPVPPTATSAPAATPSPPKIAAAPTETSAPPTATPAPTVMPSATPTERPTAQMRVELTAPTATAAPPTAIPQMTPANASTPAPAAEFPRGWLLWGALALFIGVPLALLAGGVIWWMVKRA